MDMSSCTYVHEKTELSLYTCTCTCIYYSHVHVYMTVVYGWLPVFHSSLNIFPSLSSCTV